MLAEDGDVLFPKVVFENPEYSYSLPSYQTACGALDIFNHVLDNYYLDDGAAAQRCGKNL